MAHVLLHYDEQSVQVSVRDTGRTGAPTGSAPDRVCYGLLGMRERVELYGGTLATGHASDGGFVVTASRPREATAR